MLRSLTILLFIFVTMKVSIARDMFDFTCPVTETNSQKPLLNLTFSIADIQKKIAANEVKTAANQQNLEKINEIDKFAQETLASFVADNSWKQNLTYTDLVKYLESKIAQKSGDLAKQNITGYKNALLRLLKNQQANFVDQTNAQTNDPISSTKEKNNAIPLNLSFDKITAWGAEIKPYLGLDTNITGKLGKRPEQGLTLKLPNSENISTEIQGKYCDNNLEFHIYGSSSDCNYRTSMGILLNTHLEESQWSLGIGATNLTRDDYPNDFQLNFRAKRDWAWQPARPFGK